VYCTDAYDAAKGASVLVILTEWNQFRSLDLERIKEALVRPFIVDLRNVYEPEKMRERGFTYESMGRAATDLPEE
jgi:UDPglucose 6-dehydrogenase